MTYSSFVSLQDFINKALDPDNLLKEEPYIEQVLELEFVNKDGRTYWSETVVSVVMGEDGKPCNILASGRDITERKRTETLLYKQNIELQVAKEKAEESDRLKSAFLANISHEIRTPMNGILGFADFLRNPDLTEDKKLQYIDIINSSSRQLLGIITDIIEISKIETNLITIMKSKTNINSIIDLVYSNLKLAIPPVKNIRLLTSKTLFDEDCEIITDEVKLQQVITNLVENAIKYTDDGDVEIGYRVEINTGELLFFVKDTGIGIDKANHKVIFDRFRRVEMTQATELRGGTGLGLAISKAYVELLGGRIWVESEIVKGSIFYFTLPFEKPPVNVKSHLIKAGIESSFKNKNILVAEDDDINYMYLEEILSKTSVSYSRAKNGKETLEMYLENSNYDLILMDIKMPYMNGLDVTMEIRRMNTDIPIIAQTAYAFEEERQHALKIGCNDYISKPIKRETLIAIIEKYL